MKKTLIAAVLLLGLALGAGQASADPGNGKGGTSGVTWESSGGVTWESAGVTWESSAGVTWESADTYTSLGVTWE